MCIRDRVMSGSCPRRSREHARKVSEGGRIADDAGAYYNAVAGGARVKGEAVGVLAIRKDCGRSAGSGEGKWALLLIQRLPADVGMPGDEMQRAVPSAQASLPIAAGRDSQDASKSK